MAKHDLLHKWIHCPKCGTDQQADIVQFMKSLSVQHFCVQCMHLITNKDCFLITLVKPMPPK